MTVTPYNFRKPGRLGSALEQQFHGWLATACALASSRWQKDLPQPVEILAGQLDSLRARPAFRALPDDCVAYRVALQDQLVTVMTWPRPLVLAVIGTLLGDPLDGLPGDRELTPVDESLFEFFLRDFFLPSFLESWNGEAAVRSDVSDRLREPRFAKIYTPEESLLSATLQVKGPFGESEWRWLFPKRGLLANFEDSDEGKPTPASREQVEEQVRGLPIEVVVRLGSVALPLAQLAHLRVGDIILLDQPVNQPLVADVADNEKLRGWPGRVGNRQAFRIEQWK